MSMKKQTSIAVAAVLGTAIIGNATAATLGAGSYEMSIRTTPTLLGLGIPDPGCTGSVCTNSSFTFGGFPSSAQSNAMLDSGATVGGVGGIGNDGVAGVLGFDVDASGNFTFTSYSVDTIGGTAAGDFAQRVDDPSGMSGSIDAAGNITFTPTGRLANTSGPVITDNPFNYADSPTNSIWQEFTTGTQAGLAGDVIGQALDDQNHAVLVSATAVGDNWGTFAGGTYYEVWSVDIAEVAPIPIPAAAWLFGSGLIGLVGVARRRKKA